MELLVPEGVFAMSNLLRAIGLETHYQLFRAMFPEYISRGEFFVYLRKALWIVMRSRGSLSDGSAEWNQR